MRVISLSLVLLSIAGCVAEDASYDDTWGDAVIVSEGKADGLLDAAPPLAFGEVGRGSVGGTQLDLYTLDLKRGDRFEIVMTVTGGNLDPHLSLFYGTSSSIGSKSWSRSGNTLRKTYEVESAGVYALAVRAYRNQGSGDYTVTATCTGGPCNGEHPPAEEMTVDDAAHCLTQTRRCSFERMGRYEGAVGAVRARVLFDECLGVASLGDGSSCKTACEIEGAQEHCNEIVSALPFYADQSAECLAELDGCLADCHSDPDGDADEFWSTAESICFSTGLNGNCDSYARGHTACGGTSYAKDTLAQCEEYCESTTGAWIDDLDTICTESCSHCDSVREACETECSGDWDCFERCAGQRTC